MTFLIDTHTFLWFITGSLKLSETAKELIEKDDSDIFISIASLWEISIKTAIGKLQILDNYHSFPTSSLGMHTVTRKPNTL